MSKILMGAALAALFSVGAGAEWSGDRMHCFPNQHCSANGMQSGMQPEEIMQRAPPAAGGYQSSPATEPAISMPRSRRYVHDN